MHEKALSADDPQEKAEALAIEKKIWEKWAQGVRKTPQELPEVKFEGSLKEDINQNDVLFQKQKERLFELEKARRGKQ